jgi:hypothetical protein
VGLGGGWRWLIRGAREIVPHIHLSEGWTPARRRRRRRSNAASRRSVLKPLPRSNYALNAERRQKNIARAVADAVRRGKLVRLVSYNPAAKAY